MPWGLVWRYTRSHPLRSILTLGSIVVAIFLLCTLRSLLSSMDVGVADASSNRLIVQSAVSLFVELPHSYQGKIEAVEGVDTTLKWTWFGGVYQDPSNFFAQFAVDHDRLLDVYPDIELIEGTEQEFAGKRTGCIIGEGLVTRFNWKIGDTVPLIGTIFPRNDGKTWSFEVTGIYRARTGAVDNMTMYFHHDYLDEVIDAEAASGPSGVSVYIARIEPGAEHTQVMSDIDALFENGPQAVQTTTEAEFNRQFVSMLGNIPMLLNSIGAGVLFAILLAALNTMIMAGRERTQQIGILKALGFGDGTAFALLLAESLVLCGLGGLLGVGLAVVSEEGLAAGLSSMFPNYSVGTETQILGLSVSILVGLVAGIIPAWRAKQLKPVDALRMEG